MDATTFSSSGRPDRTFAIAVAVVALFGAAELIAIGAHYTGKARAARQASQALVITTQPAATTPVPAPGAAISPTTGTAPATTVAPIAPTSTAQASPARQRFRPPNGC